MSNYTFEQFMRDVDNELTNICGLSSGDLADFMYRDAHEDGCDPLDVAYEVLEQNDFPMELL
jgi:hypothetical protein